MNRKSLFAALIFALFAFGSVSAQNFIFAYDMNVGSRGNDVVQLQTWLISNGYDIPAISSGKADKGYFGNQTQVAVIALQNAAGIPALGVVGPITRRWINEGKTIAKDFCNYIDGSSYGSVKAYPNRTILFYNNRYDYLAPSVIEQGNFTCVNNIIHADNLKGSIKEYRFDKEGNLKDGDYTLRLTASSKELVVTAPQSGESIEKGSTYTIRWAWKPMQVYLPNAGSQNNSAPRSDYPQLKKGKILLAFKPHPCPAGYVCEPVAPYTIAKDVPLESGSYSWNVSSEYPEDSYQISICTDTRCYDSSPYFSIVSKNAGNLKVIYPNGGEVFKMGTTQNIRWQTGPASDSSNVSIYIYHDHCEGMIACTASIDPIFTIASNISNSGQFSWNVGSFVSVEYGGTMGAGNYRVYICNGTQKFFTGICYASNRTFEIQGSAQVALNIDFVSPRTNESWIVNTTKYIIWTLRAGSNPTKVDMYLDEVGSCTERGVDPVWHESQLYCPPNAQKYVLDRNLPANETYGWIVATDIDNKPIAPGTYVVRLCPAGLTTGCVSGSQFKIEPVIQYFPQSNQ